MISVPRGHCLASKISGSAPARQRLGHLGLKQIAGFTEQSQDLFGLQEPEQRPPSSGSTWGLRHSSAPFPRALLLSTESQDSLTEGSVCGGGYRAEMTREP